MTRILKYTAAVALTGALAFAAATPSQARHGRNAAAIGFGVGAVAGAAAASAAYGGYYYGPGYYGGYAYEPGYAYDYDVAPGYVYSGPHFYYGHDRQRDCTVSPASHRFGACD